MKILNFILKTLSIMNQKTNSFQKYKLIWKEQYLNFINEYHFNNHSLEKKKMQAHDLYIDNIIINK
jgi:hypothetical protein